MTKDCSVLSDLQKAFATLDFKILLDKMKCIDFSGKTNDFILISLTAFFISLESVFSEAGTVNCGVLEGSILGPLLFLL